MYDTYYGPKHNLWDCSPSQSDHASQYSHVKSPFLCLAYIYSTAKAIQRLQLLHDDPLQNKLFSQSINNITFNAHIQFYVYHAHIYKDVFIKGEGA